MTTARRIRVFFYGSFINRDVLAEAGFRPDRLVVGRLPGFDIRIAPLATLVPSDEHAVYGVLCEATHEELGRLYAQSWVGEYLPEAVLVETGEGSWQAALCYIASSAAGQQAPRDYVDRIVGPGRALGFPEWYLTRVAGQAAP